MDAEVLRVPIISVPHENFRRMRDKGNLSQQVAVRSQTFVLGIAAYPPYCRVPTNNGVLGIIGCPCYLSSALGQDLDQVSHDVAFIGREYEGTWLITLDR